MAIAAVIVQASIINTPRRAYGFFRRLATTLTGPAPPNPRAKLPRGNLQRTLAVLGALLQDIVSRINIKYIQG